MIIDTPPSKQGDEVRTTILIGMIVQGVKILKSISQQTHTLYVSLQDVEQFYNEALSWLSPTFNLQGPNIQFLDRLIVLMAKSPIFLIRLL